MAKGKVAKKEVINSEAPLKKTSQKSVYNITVKVNDVVGSYEGDEVLSVLNDVVLPEIVKTMTELTIKKGDETVSRHLKTFETRRIFGNASSLEIFANTIKQQLG